MPRFSKFAVEVSEDDASEFEFSEDSNSERGLSDDEMLDWNTFECTDSNTEDEANIEDSFPQFLLYLVWKCLSQTPASMRNPTFNMMFRSEDELEKLLNESGVVLAPGLMDVVEGTTPPDIAWFRSLPSEFCVNTLKIWGVYVIILKKSGHKYLIYIGSGTSSHGLRSRFANYDYRNALGRFVTRALDQGYTIVHKGLLCWAPKPTTENKFLLRGIMLLLEATFHIIFWSMVSRKKDYCLPHLCPWPIESLKYGGCNTHIPLIEWIRGEDLGLTMEQISLKSMEREKKRKESKKLWSAQRSLERAALKKSDFQAWVEDRRVDAERSRSYRKRNPEAARQAHKNSAAKTKLTGQYSCDLCNVACLGPSSLRKHKLSKRHLKNVSKVPKSKALIRDEANRRNKTYFCHVCDVALASEYDLKRHLSKDRHLRACESLSPEEAHVNTDFPKAYKYPEIKARSERNKAAKKYFCRDCDYAGGDKSAFDRHLGTDKHKKAIEKRLAKLGDV